MNLDKEIDVFVKTTYSRKEKKPKMEFKMIVNKVFIGGLMLATMMGSVTPAFADTSGITPNPNATVTSNYDVKYGNSLEVYTDTLNLVQSLKASGVLTDGDLAILYQQLKNLNSEQSPELDALMVKTIKAVEGVNGENANQIRVLASSKMTAQTQNQSETKVIKASQPTYQAATQTKTFKDLTNHWSKKYVETLASKGAIGGYADGTFKPDKTITRGEFLSIAMGAVYPGSNKTPKVSDHWASGIVGVAVEKGILKQGEMGTDTKSLEAKITRYEMAKIMARLSITGLNEGKSTEGLDKMSNYVRDYGDMSELDKIYVSQAYLKGFITGDGESNFNGAKSGTRGEAATMLVRLIDKSMRAKVDLNKYLATLKTTYADGTPTIEYSKAKSMEALKTLKIIKENGVYKVSATLPKLAKGMQWEFNYIVSNNKTGAVVSYVETYKTYHENGLVTYIVDGVTEAQVKTGYYISVVFSVVSDDYKASVNLSVDSDLKNEVYTNILDGSRGQEDGQTGSAYNTSAIFASWK